MLPWAHWETLEENWKSITGLERRSEMDGTVGAGVQCGFVRAAGEWGRVVECNYSKERGQEGEGGKR